MSWNVQNLFDGVDNGQEYPEFSVSSGKWSRQLYELRLKNLVKIIEFNDPDIIGLQEIEGLSVLEDFSSRLKGYSYMVSTSSPGAIQLGLLSKYPIKRTGILKTYNGDRLLRPILEVSLDIDGNELIIMNNHWKSKVGSFSEHLRLKSSSVLKKRLEELKDKEVLVLGDFNENYNEYQRVYKSFDTGLMYNNMGKGITVTDGILGKNELYTPWPKSTFKGSYKYKGQWETIDNFFLNSKLLDKESFYFNSFIVDNRDFLFDKSGNIKKWYTDFKIGFSDHLPIILTLKSEGIKTNLE